MGATSLDSTVCTGTEPAEYGPKCAQFLALRREDGILEVRCTPTAARGDGGGELHRVLTPLFQFIDHDEDDEDDEDDILSGSGASLRQDSLIEEAMSAHALRLLDTLDTLDTECDSADQLDQAVAEAFAQHPGYKVITRFTGAGRPHRAPCPRRDRRRPRPLRRRPIVEGIRRRSAPVTRASGRSLSVTHRRVTNDRLAAVAFVWTFVAAAHSPGASAIYYPTPEHGDRHAAALRNVFNHLIGCLCYRLRNGQAYNEDTAFPTPQDQPEPTAA